MPVKIKAILFYWSGTDYCCCFSSNVSFRVSVFLKMFKRLCINAASKITQWFADKTRSVRERYQISQFAYRLHRLGHAWSVRVLGAPDFKCLGYTPDRQERIQRYISLYDKTLFRGHWFFNIADKQAEMSVRSNTLFEFVEALQDINELCRLGRYPTADILTRSKHEVEFFTFLKTRAGEDDSVWFIDLDKTLAVMEAVLLNLIEYRQRLIDENRIKYQRRIEALDLLFEEAEYILRRLVLYW